MESLAVSLAAKRLSISSCLFWMQNQWRFAKYIGKIYPIFSWRGSRDRRGKLILIYFCLRKHFLRGQNIWLVFQVHLKWSKYGPCMNSRGWRYWQCVCSIGLQSTSSCSPETKNYKYRKTKSWKYATHENTLKQKRTLHWCFSLGQSKISFAYIVGLQKKNKTG